MLKNLNSSSSTHDVIQAVTDVLKSAGISVKARWLLNPTHRDMEAATMPGWRVRWDGEDAKRELPSEIAVFQAKVDDVNVCFTVVIDEGELYFAENLGGCRPMSDNDPLTKEPICNSKDLREALKKAAKRIKESAAIAKSERLIKGLELQIICGYTITDTHFQRLVVGKQPGCDDSVVVLQQMRNQLKQLDKGEQVKPEDRRWQTVHDPEKRDRAVAAFLRDRCAHTMNSYRPEKEFFQVVDAKLKKVQKKIAKRFSKSLKELNHCVESNCSKAVE